MFQFRRFPTYCYFIHSTLSRYCRDGFPHSEIHGSRDICSSPWLIAACRVLLRLLMPRHSPCALSSLTSSAQTSLNSVSTSQPKAVRENCVRSVAPPLKFKQALNLFQKNVATCYGLIAVLRIMQASQKILACCCVTLKVPHLFAVATLFRAWRPLLPCFSSSSSVQFSRCRTGFETGTKYSKKL